MKLTKKQSKSLRASLPEGTPAKISKKKKISKRMANYILSGIYEDRHGVIDEAIKIRNAYAKRFLKLSKKI